MMRRIFMLVTVAAMLAALIYGLPRQFLGAGLIKTRPFLHPNPLSFRELSLPEALGF